MDWLDLFAVQPGVKPTSPALQGRFLTTGPLGKSQPSILDLLPCHVFTFLSERAYAPPQEKPLQREAHATQQSIALTPQN